MTPHIGNGIARRGPLVVLGDSMLDIDIEGDASRLSPEAPVPVVDVTRQRRRPGGAGLAALLAARSGQEVILITAVMPLPSTSIAKYPSAPTTPK